MIEFIRTWLRRIFIMPIAIGMAPLWLFIGWLFKDNDVMDLVKFTINYAWHGDDRHIIK